MIKITKRGWNHIIKYHTGMQSSSRPKKSIFNNGEDLVQLINQASLHPPVGQVRKHLARVFDVGHTVGIDYYTGKPTSTVTVVTKLNGDLVSMFPGPP